MPACVMWEAGEPKGDVCGFYQVVVMVVAGYIKGWCHEMRGCSSISLEA